MNFLFDIVWLFHSFILSITNLDFYISLAAIKKSAARLYFLSWYALFSLALTTIFFVRTLPPIQQMSQEMINQISQTWPAEQNLSYDTSTGIMSLNTGTELAFSWPANWSHEKPTENLARYTESSDQPPEESSHLLWANKNGFWLRAASPPVFYNWNQILFENETFSKETAQQWANDFAPTVQRYLPYFAILYGIFTFLILTVGRLFVLFIYIWLAKFWFDLLGKRFVLSFLFRVGMFALVAMEALHLILTLLYQEYVPGVWFMWMIAMTIILSRIIWSNKKVVKI